MEQNKKIKVEKVENKKRKKQKPRLVKLIKGRNNNRVLWQLIVFHFHILFIV